MNTRKVNGKYEFTNRPTGMVYFNITQTAWLDRKTGQVNYKSMASMKAKLSPALFEKIDSTLLMSGIHTTPAFEIMGVENQESC
jgi:hypothetical protein